MAGSGRETPDRALAVAEGSIHTTYRLEFGSGAAARSAYLRLYEGGGPPGGEEAVFANARWELALLRHLRSRGAAVAIPWRLGKLKDGDLGDLGGLGKLRGRPVAIFDTVPGEARAPASLTPAERRSLGATLRTLHEAGRGFGPSRPNRYGPETLSRWLAELEVRLDRSTGERRQLQELLPALQSAQREGAVALAELESDLTLCHGDLFPDNVHFLAEKAVGIFDLEMAFHGARAWDLAVLYLVWSFDAQGPLPGAWETLLEGYCASPKGLASERGGPAGPAGDFELAAIDGDLFHGVCRFVAARYCVSRVRDFLFSELDPTRLRSKPWTEFRDRLLLLEALPARKLLPRPSKVGTQETIV